MVGLRSPTFHVTAHFISRQWKVFSWWCYADFQQRSNQRLVVLLQTPSSSFHGVKTFSRPDTMKFFKKNHSFDWAVLTQTRTNSFHGVQELFCVDHLQPFKTIQVCGWAALPNIPCHAPAHFAALKNHFVLIMCIFSTTFNWTASRAPANTIQPISRCWNIFSFEWLEAFKLPTNLCLSCALPNTAQFLSRCWTTFFVWMLCSHLKPFKFMAGPRSPTSPVTAQLILRRWRVISFWCYADCQQRSKERLVVLPQTRSSSFHGGKQISSLDGMKLFKNIRVLWLGRVPPNTAQFYSQCWRTFSSGWFAAI